MVPPPPSPTSSAAQHTQQFLSSVLSQRGPSSLPYSEDVKWLIRQHLLSLSEAYPSLKPQTATFTHNDGRSVNLLQSDGTVPMVFQNVTYNIPVVIWLMETYPRHPPLVFVNPTRDMVIKRQHPFVNPSGSVSIPYLQNWVYHSSNLVDLARNLGNYFGSDPPLYSQRRPNPNPIPNQNPNPSPSFNASGSSASVSSGSIRPAIPPRTYPPSPYVTSSGRIPSPSPPQRMGSGSFEDPSEVYKRNAINKLVENVHSDVGRLRKTREAEMEGMKGILNKLTPQNFEKLFEQVKQVNIDNAGTLSGVISQIFDKALMEPTFVEMYAIFCSRLSVELPDFSEDNEKITFRRLLVNKCQEEFERGEREQAEANRTEEEGEVKQTEEQREEKRVQARRRMLGNIRLIGELYKKKMLTERIMHECIKKLFGEEYDNPDEENIESLCTLMSTIGEMIDHAKAKEHMDVYFNMMFKLSNNMKLSSRVRFMLKDVIDLRKNRWHQRRKVEGSKKIEEVHRDAANEQQAQSNRLARGPNPNPVRRGPGQPMDFGPKGSNILPNPQTGYRGLQQQQPRGYGNQDTRFEERHSFVPLRPVGDDSITLGPQGGLARGMSVRGQPSMRGVGGPNGYGSVPERSYGARDDPGPRYSPRPAYEPENLVPLSSPLPRERVPTPPQSGPSDKVLSDDRLHDMSVEAIKEFYSARDEKEVALCVKDLNAPGFYPTMISIWVTDSFERKDMDRESLTKLLINLTKSQEILSQDSLVKGFESVLSTLEDAVNDAPKAAEFLGRIFARVVLENVIPYKEISRLIYEGGEEQGRLVEIGLAAEVVGVILEIVKSEKGDSFLNDLRADSNPRLENFRSPNIKKASRLDKFI